MVQQPDTQSPLACDLTAIEPAQRAAHEALGAYLVKESAQERRELPDGYAFRFAAEQYAEITAFIANERLCCPFFHFALDVMPDRGPIWLHLTGREGVKALLAAEFGQ
jgi:hypothetical protein